MMVISSALRGIGQTGDEATWTITQEYRDQFGRELWLAAHLVAERTLRERAEARDAITTGFLNVALLTAPTDLVARVNARREGYAVTAAGERGEPLCSGCGGPHPYDTSIPSPVWNRVIRAAGLDDYLCAACILAAFVCAGESFTATLWGDDFNENGVPIEVRIGSAPARDAQLLRAGINDALPHLLDAMIGEGDAAQHVIAARGCLLAALDSEAEVACGR